MARVDDVAAAILQRTGPLSTWKLQKLVYYCQAWHLTWDDEPLFDSRVEAWGNGPAVPALYEKHRGKFEVDAWKWGDPTRLTPSQVESIEAVLDTYGDKSNHWLSALTHMEPPWQNARRGLGPAERGESVIAADAMVEYYSSLV